MNCDFCDEFRHPENSRFAQIYTSHFINRIVAQLGNLVAIPTIGQLFPGSLLIMPITHIETMASLSKDELLQLSSFIDDLEAVIECNGPVIAFEHGARCETGGGCGIYHAHIHLVPVSGSISVDDLLPMETDSASFKPAPSLIAGLQELKSSQEYLIVKDSENQVRYIASPSLLGKKYPSQYFRRRLTNFFRLECSWDWRTYKKPEQYVFETINMFKDINVSLCK